MPTSPDSPKPTPAEDPPSRFADDWDAAVIVRPEDQLPPTAEDPD